MGTGDASDSDKPDSGARTSLTSRVAYSAGWIVGGRFVMGMFGFLNTIIVARLLAPEDFGLVAIGVTAMQLLTNISDIGVSQAVIRFRDADRADLDTLFTLSALRGVLIAVVMTLAAPLAVEVYHDPRVFWVFIGAAMHPLLLGLVNPRFFEFERNLDYSKEFVALIVNKIAGVVISIAIAVIYRSYWAIILGLVSSAGVQLVLSYAMKPYRPRISFRSFRRILDFSGWLTGVGFMAALNNKLDSMILARVIGKAGAGVYFIGQQLSELPSREIAVPITRAIYPGLSELQGDPARMRAAFLRGVEALGAIAMPAAIGFALVARDLTPLLLGDKWLAAVPVVEIMTPVMGVQMPLMATQYYAMALGLTKLVFIRELIFFLVRTPVFVWASIEYGLVGAAWAVAATGVVHILLNLALYARASGDNAIAPMWRARRSIVSSAAMAALIFWLRGAGAVETQAPIIRLCVEILAGVGAYIAVHTALWRLDGMKDGVERSILHLGEQLIARARL